MAEPSGNPLAFPRPPYAPPGTMLEPRERCELTDFGQTGMSLRDYFAGQALANPYFSHNSTDGCAGLAKRCYEMADAMLAARTAPEGE